MVDCFGVDYDTSDTTSAVWYSWTSCDNTTSATTSNDNVWRAWSGTSITTNAGITQNYQPRQLTPEEIAAQRQAAEARYLEAEQRERERQEAKGRAEELLRMFLTPEQKENLEKMSAFLVKSESDRLYRIRRGRTGNIEELDKDGKVIARLCVHPQEMVPDADTMLAQKLWLETNEAGLLRVANRFPVVH